MADFSFPKEEKLCGKTTINRLFSEGKHFVCYPLRVTYLVLPQSEEPTTTLTAVPKVLIWAPKSLHKRANKRNMLRRQMREAYRLNATQLKTLCSKQNKEILVAFNYISKEILEFSTIETATQKSLSKLLQKLNQLDGNV